MRGLGCSLRLVEGPVRVVERVPRQGSPVTVPYYTDDKATL